jgi:hypothetical protein
VCDGSTDLQYRVARLLSEVSIVNVVWKLIPNAFCGIMFVRPSVHELLLACKHLDIFLNSSLRDTVEVVGQLILGFVDPQ